MLSRTIRSVLTKTNKCFVNRTFTNCAPRFSGNALLEHVDTDDNRSELPFDFTPHYWEEANKILAKYPPHGKQSATVPLLDLAQRQCKGYVPIQAMHKIAEICGVPRKQVYENATFYAMFNRTPVGKYHVQVCVTTPCMLRGCDEIMEALEKHLGCKNGETDSEGLFTLGEMECMGACVNAPMVVISDYSNPPNFSYDFYEDLTVESAIEVLEKIRRGQKPTVGPQNGRPNSLGPQGRTSLFFDKGSEVQKPYCRDINAQPENKEQKK
ncbi:NADH dehydrogenase flavoprotein [Acrasis kona]|uniref:NADH dehydrogenase flavoprotein n=1 Tax=Acrasis kona TaxID=1008807 RepID=A0AAW2ZK69_9EUKA